MKFFNNCKIPTYYYYCLPSGSGIEEREIQECTKVKDFFQKKILIYVFTEPIKSSNLGYSEYIIIEWVTWVNFWWCLLGFVVIGFLKCSGFRV